MAAQFPEPDAPASLDDDDKPKAKIVSRPPPAKKRTAAKKKPATTTTKAPSAISLEGRLQNTFEAIGGGISFVNPDDGEIIVMQAEPLAKALNKLAEQNPNVKKILTSLTKGGAWGEVFAVVFVGIAIPIASNHGWQPPWISTTSELPQGDWKGDPDAVKGQPLDDPPIVGGHKPFGA